MKKEKQQVQDSVQEEKSVGTDYNEYELSKLEFILYAVLAAAVLFVVGYIFYQNIILSAILAAFGIFYPKSRRKQIIQSRKNKLNLQFKDMLYSLSSAVGAGSSVESALTVVLEDMRQQYNDPNAFIIKELELMVTRVQMNRTIEEVFGDFARRSHLEDIETFANIFEISKRTGGNLIEIIRNTTQIIADKVEIKMEIDTLLSGQQMEQKVLTVMPIALIWFMTKTSPDLMSSMFGTPVGIAISTFVLVVILIGNAWAKKIANIQM